MKTCFINNVLTKLQRYNVNLLASNYSLISQKNKKNIERNNNIANPTNVINNNLIFVLLSEGYK